MIHHRQSGVALIQVLLVFAILSSVALQLVYQQRVSIVSTQHRLDASKHHHALSALEATALDVLRDLDVENMEDQATPWSELDGNEDAQWTYRIERIQHRINANWLHAKSGVLSAPDILNRVLAEVEDGPAWVGRMRNWVSQAQETAHADLVSRERYFNSGMPIAHASELNLMMESVDDETEEVQSLLSFLPPAAPLDVTVAQQATIQSIDPRIGSSQWAALLEARKGGDAVAEWLAAEAMETVAEDLSEEWFTDRPSYFVVNGIVNVNGQVQTVSTLVRRELGKFRIVQRLVERTTLRAWTEITE